jgi:hypothetical protein
LEVRGRHRFKASFGTGEAAKAALSQAQTKRAGAVAAAGAGFVRVIGNQAKVLTTGSFNIRMAALRLMARATWWYPIATTVVFKCTGTALQLVVIASIMKMLLPA